jgi:hypothetical protein
LQNRAPSLARRAIAFGEQVTAIAAVAPIGLAELGHALEMLIDQLVHPAFEQLGERLPGSAAIVSPYSRSLACMAFIIQNAAGQLLIVAC